jgi:sulfur carrier protein
MIITINGDSFITKHLILATCLEEFGAIAPFAAAVNGVFIPQSTHLTHVLKEGDFIELLSPIQGG